ncbi:unnamed protein product [Anisakis simplex]|uniref:Glyco_hydro_38N domain-containing protein n=1 Tax=Anisakis simplex TaxID=6269 RepID=A0A0M3K0B7_ANISI|nr:unnamed protein product [Anisakis simplex]
MTRLPLVSFTRRKLKVMLLVLVTVVVINYMIKFYETSDNDRPSKSRYIVANNHLLANEGRVIDRFDQPIRDILNGGDADDDNRRATCTQKYPQEAVTDFNTFDLYNGGRKRQDIVVTAKRRNKTGTASNKLNVFVLPMTHVDPGWLETFDAYSKDTNQILDNMLKFLRSHPEMRFMWCEMVFFERWWQSLNSTMKGEVKQFVKSGQLEMTSGSWVMTDEASPFFPVTIDNIVEGQQFLYDQLGIKAKTIWSNDPFGYGSTVPYLFTKTGIRWAVINRIHHPTKNYLQHLRAAPFKWRQYFDSGQSDVLTHLLPFTHYDILNSCGPSQSTCCQFDFKRLTHFSCPDQKPVPITPQNVHEKFALK